MVDPTIGPNSISTRSDLGSGDEMRYAYWMGQERIADKEEGKWRKQSRKIVQRYRDERPESINDTHRFNVLWSNVQTLKPALYARTPKADVQRRFLDQDDTGRLASMILERALSYSLESGAFDAVMEAVVEDRLLPGRGTARILYVPHYGETIEETEPDGDNLEFEQTEAAADNVDGLGDELTSTQRNPEPLREVVYEEVIPSYVFWEDYRESPARSWREVTWIRYRAYMTRDELVDRFGRIGKTVNLDFTPKGGTTETGKDAPPPDLFKKAVVFEFWDKVKKRVVWIAPGTPDVVLDEVDDPLGLPDFFPSPDPLLATTTTDRRVPVPDYHEYQDQAHELDTLTARIDVLIRAVKVSGIYAGSEKQVMQQLVDEGTENRLIPVENWQSFSDKGGLAGCIEWMPIKQIAETLNQLFDARDRSKQLLYEVTGIGDVMRGATQPMETATAQNLKASFTTRRIVPQQRAVARFARDIIRIMGAIIASQFSGETLSMISGFPELAPVPALPPEPPQMVPNPAAMQQRPTLVPQGLPPEAAQNLREGAVTTFRNGQKWTQANGQPRKVA